MANEFEFEVPGGGKVFTGMKMPETMPLSFVAFPKPAIRSLSDIAELVKESKTLDIRREWANEVNWFNQGNKSSCNAYMIAWIICILIWRFTGGKTRLSPEWVYSIINGGEDGGSMLDDGMVQAFEGGMPAYAAAFYQRYRQGQFSMEEKRWATQSAKDHRFAECYKAPTDSFENMMLALFSCIAEGGAVGMAVHVGDQYMRSGSVAGFDDGDGNHAIAGAQLELLTPNPKSINDIQIVSPQSWGSRFANKGFTNITAKHCYRPGRYHAFYCVRAVTATADAVEACRIK